VRARKKSVELAPDAGRALDASALEAALGYRLRMLEQLVMRSFSRRLEPYDITPTLYSILVLIQDNPACRQTELSQALGMQPPNLVERVSRLVERGYVARAEDTADRRANVLSLTAAGVGFMQAVSQSHEDHVAEISELLGRERYESLVELTALPVVPAID
jgi:DNA-binding MarR family transcriptional regulator